MALNHGYVESAFCFELVQHPPLMDYWASELLSFLNHRHLGYELFETYLSD